MVWMIHKVGQTAVLVDNYCMLCIFHLIVFVFSSSFVFHDFCSYTIIQRPDVVFMGS